MSDLAPRLNIPTLIARALIQQVPLVGPLVAEVISETLPRVHEQRVVDMLEDVVHRLGPVEDAVGLFQRRLEQPVFLDLFEESVREAARSTSVDRTRHISALLTNGLSGPQAQAAGYRHLLGLVHELNDVEILLACLLARSGRSYDEFWRRHKDALTFPHQTSLDDGSVSDEAVLTDSYFQHLERLGLIEPEPVGESATAQKWTDRRRLTELGRLLIRTIGELDQTTAVREGIPWHIGPEQLVAARKGVQGYWDEVCKAVQSLVEQTGVPLHIHCWDINLSARHTSGMTASGFVNPDELWIWIDYCGARNPLRSLWVLVGRDDTAWFWEYRGRRSDSLQSLATLAIAPLLRQPAQESPPMT